MTPLDCAQVREQAAELALDLLTGAERAAALAHLAACPACRAEVASLTDVGEALLGLVPEVEPSLGFESRVVGRILELRDAASAPQVDPWPLDGLGSAGPAGSAPPVDPGPSDGFGSADAAPAPRIVPWPLDGLGSAGPAGSVPPVDPGPSDGRGSGDAAGSDVPAESRPEGPPADPAVRQMRPGDRRPAERHPVGRVGSPAPLDQSSPPDKSTPPDDGHRSPLGHRGPHRPGRRRVLAAMAAAVAALAVGIGSLVWRHGDDRGSAGEVVAAADLRTDAGAVVGRATVRTRGDDPAVVTVEMGDWVDRLRGYGTAGHSYWLSIDTGTGPAELYAMPIARDGPWHVALDDRDQRSVAAVSVVDETGRIWCGARFVT